MEDPLVALILYADTRGFLRLEDFEYSPRGKLAIDIRLNAAAKRLKLDVTNCSLKQYCGIISSQYISEQSSQTLFDQIDTLHKQYCQLLTGQTASESTVKDENVDLAARWYIIFAPDVLRRLGVEI